MMHTDSDAKTERLCVDVWHRLGREFSGDNGGVLTDERVRQLGEVACRRAEEELRAVGLSEQDAADEAKLFAADVVMRLIYNNADMILAPPAD